MPGDNQQQRLALAQARLYRRALDQELRHTNTQVALRQKRLVGPRVKEKAEGDFTEARQRFLDAASATRPLYDQVMADYKRLSEDSSVKNALKAHNQMTKSNLRLGPSDHLRKDVSMVKQYERMYSPETAPRPTRRVYRGIKVKGRTNRTR